MTEPTVKLLSRVENYPEYFMIIKVKTAYNILRSSSQRYLLNTVFRLKL